MNFRFTDWLIYGFILITAITMAINATITAFGEEPIASAGFWIAASIFYFCAEYVRVNTKEAGA